MADKFVKATDVGQYHVAAVTAGAPARPGNFAAELARLSARLDKIETGRSRGRAQNQGRSRSRSPSRDKSQNLQAEKTSGICRLHRKFGEKARFCKPPCSFRPDDKKSKENEVACLEIASSNQNVSKRLHIRDRELGIVFLIDSSSELSIIPVSEAKRKSLAELKLYAANGTCIDTFGEVYKILNLGLRRPFAWNFCVAAVPYPIIGADLLDHYDLLVDIKGRRLLDRNTLR